MVAAERDIFTAQAKESGKPDDIIEKMISGRIRKYLGEITLLGQSFVKDPDQTVGKLLKQADASVVRFERIELGEGIEKWPRSRVVDSSSLQHTETGSIFDPVFLWQLRGKHTTIAGQKYLTI